MIEIHSQITHWYKININSGWDTPCGVFKLFLSFTLSPFGCKSEDIPILRGNIMISLILKSEKIWLSDKARIISIFLILNQIWFLKVFWLVNSNVYGHGTDLGHMFLKNVNKRTHLLKFFFFHYKKNFSLYTNRSRIPKDY